MHGLQPVILLSIPLLVLLRVRVLPDGHQPGVQLRDVLAMSNTQVEMAYRLPEAVVVEAVLEMRVPEVML
jgi:hypothetical protein